jgi:hypothetical protein
LDGEPTHRRLSPAMKIGVGVLVALVTWVDLGFNTVTLCVVLVSALAVQALYGAYVWFHAPVPGVLLPLTAEEAP